MVLDDKIHVFLAEDSQTVRHHLASIIAETPDMRVVGEARNGQEAINMVAELRPHVVSMDINMPKLDGLDATRHIMANSPTPIVVVSSFLETDVQLSLQAIEAGALAVVNKPLAQQHPAYSDEKQHLLKTLRAMAGVKVISRRQRKYPKRKTTEMIAVKDNDTHHPELIVIGASTGGPNALFHLLKELPAELPVPIIIVQHMPSEFIEGLATWLNSATPLDVVIASDDMRIERGMVILASGTKHLTVKRHGKLLRTRYCDADEDSRYIPSVDALFQSVAQVVGKNALAVMLTGMGDDGASGLLAIHQAGGHTLVQDEQSSTVFGMPRAAIEIGAAQNIVPLSKLATKILKLL